MRVDLVITELFVGGAERCLTELALGLSDSEDEVRVFSLGSLPGAGRRLLVDSLETAGIPVESAHADSPLKLYQAYRRLRDWLYEGRADVCQTFLHHANVVGAWAAPAAGVDLLVAGLRVAESRPLRCRMERSALAKAESVVCVSSAVQEFAASRLGCGPDKSVVIPNGVDVSRFASATPQPWSAIGWPDGSIVSLFVGRLHRQKGIELLQQSVDRLAPAGSNRRLLIVGEGPLQKQLKQWIDKVGDDRVKLLPWQADVAPLMAACRLLILPSHYEGMPNVVLEAMAAGRPVVCSRVEGSEELLAHLPSQSFPAGDATAMVESAEPLLSDRQLSNEIGESNQSRVRNDFSIAAMVDAYRSHYRALLSGRGAVD